MKEALAVETKNLLLNINYKVSLPKKDRFYEENASVNKLR